MVYENLVYNPKYDKCPVSQDGFVDLVDAFANRMIPDSVPPTELKFSDCEDTGALLPKAEDVFDTIQQSHTIRSISDSRSNDSAEVKG